MHNYDFAETFKWYEEKILCVDFVKIIAAQRLTLFSLYEQIRKLSEIIMTGSTYFWLVHSGRISPALLAGVMYRVLYC